MNPACHPPFCAGNLRHPVYVQKKDKVTTDAGGQTVTWSARYTLYCQVRPLNGREVYAYSQLNAIETKVFETWWVAGILGEDRIIFEGEQYNIAWIENHNSMDRWMRIYATKGVIN